jgi:hypothetical protein
MSRPGSMTVGGLTTRKSDDTLNPPSEGTVLKWPSSGCRYEGRMVPLETSAASLRDRALTLALEQGVDPEAWYLRVLAEERKEGVEPDLGALVRVYWELQRVTGRADLHDTWRSLADALWSGEAA